MPPQRQITVEDTETGQSLTFEWMEQRDPTQQEIAEIFAARAQVQQQGTGPLGFVPTERVRGPALGSRFFRGLTGFETPGQARQVGGQVLGTLRQSLFPTGATPQERIGRQGQANVDILRGAAAIPTGIARASFEQFQKALEARKRGDVLGTTIAGVGTIPVVGDPLARLATEVRETGEVAGPAAEAAGMALPLVLGAGAGRLNPMRGRSLPGLPGAEKIPLRPSQRGLFPAVTGRMEAFLERTMAGAGPASRQAKVANQAVANLADDTFDRVAAKRLGDNPIDDGEQIMTAVQRAASEAAEVASADLDELLTGPVGDAVASRKSLKVAASRLLNEMEPTRARAGGIFSDRRVGADVQFLDDILQSNDFADVRTLQRERRRILEMIRGQQNLGALVSDAPSVGILKQLEQPLDRAMLAGVRREFGPAGAKQLDDALGQWRKIKETFDDAVLQRITQAEAPERFGRLLLGMGSRAIAKVQKALPAQEYGLMKRNALAHLFNEAAEGELVTPALAAGAEGATLGASGGAIEELGARAATGQAIRRFDGKKLEKMIEDIGDARLRLMFGPTAKDDLVRVAQAAQRANQAGGLAGVNVTAPRLFAAGFDATIIYSFIAGQPMAGLGSAAVTNLISRVMFNPSQRRVLIAGLNAIANNNAPQFAFMAARMNDMLQREQLSSEQQPVMGLPGGPQRVQLPPGIQR